MPRLGNAVPAHSVRVMGLGSAHGDDRVGWEVIERLRSGESEIELHATGDPLSIAASAAGCRLLIVIDACRGAGTPGSVHRLEWPDPRIGELRTVSTHGMGLASALQLAEALNQLPSRVVVFAVEAESSDPGASLSPAVTAAIPALISMVLAEAATAKGATND